eukprot:TRINITY_DN8403_c0_g1_i1.p1 TRINITY_DN8403_c0_g1~~TRINITY_DN8403_c0_g1_i1.p1  ORF type:complete len:306 (+),score=33.16 TRINITY_DN8403_c0_g1_i1:41-919(+)
MGTLIGHILPGTFFFIFGLIGIIDGFKRYFQSFMRGKAPYRSRTCTRYRYKDRKTNMYKDILLESIFKTFAAMIGIVGEIVTGLDPKGIIEIHNSQHCIMYCLFGVQGLVEIIVHRVESSAKVPSKVLPPNLDYIFGALAFGGETLLFYWHLHGRNTLDIYVHTFLVYACLSCTLLTIFEIVKRNNFSLFLLRNASIILQGTWFYHVGFILYPISENIHWDPNSHRDLMLIPIYFILHVLSVSTLLGIIGFLFYGFYKDEIQGTQYFEVQSDSKQRVSLTSDSDSELGDLNL